jgi:YgiT-type zinc finger domain-containing protein
MKCVICKQGETEPGTTTITFDREGITLVVRSVPAEVCDICGEAYVDGAVNARLLEQAEDAARKGVQVEVREYSAA